MSGFSVFLGYWLSQHSESVKIVMGVLQVIPFWVPCRALPQNSGDEALRRSVVSYLDAIRCGTVGYMPLHLAGGNLGKT